MASNRVQIRVSGKDAGEIQREEEEIATLVFGLKPGVETAELIIDDVGIYEGDEGVSQESSPGWIVISPEES